MSADIIEIIRKISPDFPIEALMREAGGRVWYVKKRPYGLIREAIKADPCREIESIMRKYGVSRGFVYSVWRG